MDILYCTLVAFKFFNKPLLPPNLGKQTRSKGLNADLTMESEVGLDVGIRFEANTRYKAGFHSK